MAENKKEAKYLPIFVALVGAFGGGVSSNYLWVKYADPETVRPDPFYGAQGRALIERVDLLESELRSLRRNVDALPPRELTERILKLELIVEQLHEDFEALNKLK